jgi:hypothetical protein
VTIPESLMPPGLRLCLYIAGEWPNSLRALANLSDILAGCEVQLEVVDCLADPERGLRDGVWVTPTLVRLDAVSARRVVGDLSNRDVVVDALRATRS